jgi:hypothetical protein
MHKKFLAAIAAFVILFAMGVIAMVLAPGEIDRGLRYPWQVWCDQHCERKLGSQLEWINSKTCDELRIMYEAKTDPTFKIRNKREWFLAIEDRLRHSSCQK